MTLERGAPGGRSVSARVQHDVTTGTRTGGRTLATAGAVVPGAGAIYAQRSVTGANRLLGTSLGVQEETPIPSALDAAGQGENIFRALATRQRQQLGKHPSSPRRDHVWATPSWAPLCAGPPTHQKEILVGPGNKVRARMFKSTRELLDR